MGFGEEGSKGKVPFSSHCMKGTQYYQYDLNVVNVDLQHLAQVVFRFLCCLCVVFILSWFTTYTEMGICAANSFNHVLFTIELDTLAS